MKPFLVLKTWKERDTSPGKGTRDAGSSLSGHIFPEHRSLGLHPAVPCPGQPDLPSRLVIYKWYRQQLPVCVRLRYICKTDGCNIFLECNVVRRIGIVGKLEICIHPYTKYLLEAVPQPDPNQRKEDKEILTGEIPSPMNPPEGCRFHTRCPYADDRCRTEQPSMQSYGDRCCACHQNQSEAFN